MNNLNELISEVLPKEKKQHKHITDCVNYDDCQKCSFYERTYNQALLDVHSSIPKIIEIVRKEERAEVYQDLCDACEGDFDAIDTISEFISAIKKKKK